jgi:glycine hydroxymethyltransferase
VLFPISGPQGGIIFTNDRDLYKAVSKTVFPWFVSNHHLHRLPAMAVTALEMMEFGRDYAQQVVSNAKAFAEALSEEGFKVPTEGLGFTKSHAFVVDVRPQGGGAKVAKLLEEANIILNKNLLPWDPPEAVKDPSGIRIGTQEMTRFGMKEDDFRELARIIREAVIDGKDPAEVRKKVIEFRKNFLEVKYGYDIPEDLKDSVIKVPMLL